MIKFVMKLLGIKSSEERLAEIVAIHRENAAKLKRFDRLIASLAKKHNELPECDFKEKVSAHIDFAVSRRDALREAHTNNALLVACAEATLVVHKGSFT